MPRPARARGGACVGAARAASRLAPLPHLHELAPGVHAALGYNGRGVAMATVMGKGLADRVLGGGRAALPPTPPPPTTPARGPPAPPPPPAPARPRFRPPAGGGRCSSSSWRGSGPSIGWRASIVAALPSQR